VNQAYQSHKKEEPVMANDSIVWVGMDTDAKKNHVALYRGWEKEPAAEWEAGMDAQGIKKLIERLKREQGEVRCVYEAGPCGYELYRKLRKAGIHGDVIAPSLTPRKPGDRVKTNRRDGRNLARLYRAGELTVIDVPDEKQEALRDLTRAREDVREDLTRRQHRLNRFLVRQGCHYQDGDKWTQKHWAWIRKIHFDDTNAQTVLEESIRAVEQSQEQLKTFDSKIEENAQKPEYAKKIERYQTLRGVSTITSMTIVAEVWDMRRYGTAPQFMGSTGLVSSEYSTGEHERRGKITKAGNAHLRRVLVEAAWHYRHRSNAGAKVKKRRKGQPEAVVSIAERADQRLNHKFRRMVDVHNKKPVIAAVAVARELAGFIWAIGQIQD
jgi:transposase